MFYIWKDLCFQIYLVLHMMSYESKKKYKDRKNATYLALLFTALCKNTI